MSISTDLKDDELSIGKLIRKKRKEKGSLFLAFLLLFVAEMFHHRRYPSGSEINVIPTSSSGLNCQNCLIFRRNVLLDYTKYQRKDKMKSLPE